MNKSSRERRNKRRGAREIVPNKKRSRLREREMKKSSAPCVEIVTSLRVEKFKK